MDFILKGLAASRGLARGRVKIVHEWTAGLTLERGEVLVTRFPLPSLTPLLSQTAALVCAYGGSLSALVTIAREFRVPAVMGLGNAIEQLSDGDEVWVDGNVGTVSSFDPHGTWRVSIQSIMRTSPASDESELAAVV